MFDHLFQLNMHLINSSRFWVNSSQFQLHFQLLLSISSQELELQLTWIGIIASLIWIVSIPFEDRELMGNLILRQIQIWQQIVSILKRVKVWHDV